MTRKALSEHDTQKETATCFDTTQELRVSQRDSNTSVQRKLRQRGEDLIRKVYKSTQAKHYPVK